MRRKSSLMVVTMLALLLTSAVPVAGAKISLMHKLDFTCTNAGTLQAANLTEYGTKNELRAYARFLAKDIPCVKGTVEYTIQPFEG